MEFRQLEYFETLARELNFTRAAEACRVAQPSLSQQIQKLERELGGPLFHRLGRRIRLTDLGEALLPRVEHMLQLHKETLHEASERVGGGGRIRFGAILTIAPYLMHRVVASIDAVDHRKVEIEEDFTDNLLRKLQEGVLDFAVMSTPVDEPNLLVRTMASEAFVAVLPKNHFLAKEPKLSVTDLLREDFLLLSSIHCAGEQISDLCGLARDQPTSMQCTQIETILRLVESDAGVSILPQMALHPTHYETLAIRELEGNKPHREITIVQHQDRYISPACRSLIGEVEDAVQNLCADSQSLS